MSTPSTAMTPTEEEMKALDSSLGKTEQVILDTSTYSTLFTAVIASYTAPSNKLNPRSPMIHWKSFKQQIIITLSNIPNVEELFTKDSLDTVIATINVKPSYLDTLKSHSNIIKRVTVSRAIYIALVQCMSAEMIDQSKNHLQYSLYSLWTAIIMVIEPLDVTTGLKSSMRVLSPGLWNDDPLGCASTVKELAKKMRSSKLFDEDLILYWLQVPDDLRSIVENAMLHGNMTYDQVAQAVHQQHALNKTRLSMTKVAMTKPIVTGAADDDEEDGENGVRVMKAAVQYHRPQNKWNKGGNQDRRNSNNNNNGENKKKGKRTWCISCKRMGTHTADKCWELPKFLQEMTGLLGPSARDDTTGTSSGNKP